MQGLLLKLGSWLLQKSVAAALIILVAVAGYGLWLYLQEEDIFEERRVEKMQQALAERDRLVEAQAAIDKRIAEARALIEKQKENAKQADKIITTLRELQSWWERWFGNKEQQTHNVERLQKMEKLKSDTVSKVAELQRVATQAVWERDGLEVALRRTNAEITNLEASRSRARHFAVIAWEKTKWWILIALAGYFFGPTLWSLAMYFGLAPFMSRGRPIRLGPDPEALPNVEESRVSIETVLQPGDVLRIKERLRQ